MPQFMRSFYHRNTITVAKGLLGKTLVRKIGKRILKGKIVETEAYCGPRDLASHASKGKTPRTEVMFGKPGIAYIYIVYGMYHCFNIVTEKNGYPAAVLIRAVETPTRFPLQRGRMRGLRTNGPGKLCRYFRIDRTLNKEDLVKSKKIWIEKGISVSSKNIARRPRIGVDYAGAYKHKLWRFYIKNNSFVSKK